jgi:hypothetical protein
MGAIRNGTIGGVLNAILCPANTYGVVDEKYGLVVTPCTPCPTNLVTPATSTDATLKAQSYLSVSGITTATTSIASTGTGYFNVAACLTQAGYGYYNGASQQCPKGFYNAAGNRDVCKQCPYGTTTTGTDASQDAVDDCDAYLAGFGLVNGATDLCALGTWQAEDVTLSTACSPCTGNHWTPAVGGVEDYAATPAVVGSITCNRELPACCSVWLEAAVF